MTASYVYLSILAAHVAALALFGGTILATELRRLGIGMPGYSVDELIDGLRRPKRAGIALALVSGVALFAFHPDRYLHDTWFWAKIVLLLALAIHTRRIGREPRSPKVAAAVTLAMWAGVICAGRGPATIKDVMHSVIDPAGDFVFQSVKQIGDERGSHEQAPRSDADWEDLRERLALLQEAPQLVMGRQGARMRDRSKNPQSESQPEEIDRALADPAALARRAQKLQDAAAMAAKAADARDTQALLGSIDAIDKACENCHLHYWYPNDKRAQQAAQEDGVTDY